MSSAEEALAVRVGEAMWARDSASQALGMTLEEVRPGYARVRMTVRSDMLNGHGTCHGGLVFALADSAFAFACNSREGDELLAVAQERSLEGRNGVYDVDVTRADGGVVATFRGRSAATRATVLGDAAS
jgi:acyl-CoA thioesterase